MQPQDPLCGVPCCAVTCTIDLHADEALPSGSVSLRSFRPAEAAEWEWRGPGIVRKPKTLPAVAKTDAEDTGSSAESANRALHHLRTLVTGVRTFECAFSVRTSSFVHG
jgi:hypothetical protein